MRGGGSAVATPHRRFVETVATYLEMRAPPTRPPTPAPEPGLTVVRAERPTVSFYLYLYDTVGAPWAWTERRLMPEPQLAALITDPAVEIRVLWRDGVPAGFAELDRRSPPDIALSYLGLMPEFIGRGLGRYLLDQTVAAAWLHHPRRVWLHTCTLDHPRALDLYLGAGFTPYLRRVERITLPVEAFGKR